MVADRWKIQAVLSLLSALPFERFVVAGLNKPEGKTYRFIDKLGYRVYDVYREVVSLGIENYSMGPLRDERGRSHDLWVFGKYIELYEAYIKFAVFISFDTIAAVCVSFHEAEHPLAYPYGRGGKL
ncbi:toxin [Raoultibacter phocaeensis]|uniref:toxin n=1 Tax=Raoultibacter phocaeensis TaxID=2479841 RepID=UPI002103D580|nr:toxin [Raoultibacter phocaeensis]